MSKGPKWFQELPKKTQEMWEQRAHLTWGIVYGILGIDRTVFHKREFVTQWPPGDPIIVDGKEYYPADRVLDTATDLKAFAVGGTIGGYIKDFALITTIIVLAIRLA